MVALCLSLVLIAYLIAAPLTRVIRNISARIGAHDTAPVPGQVKEASRPVPNTGGIAIFLAIATPILLGLAFFHALDPSPTAEWRTDFSLVPADVEDHVAGIQQQTPLALTLLACLAFIHILGLVDDRRPLGPWLKLALMAIPALAIPILTDTRLLTLLDAHAGGPWLSILITALWFLVVTNALNFMDNMDGLSGGVGLVASSCFLAAALMQGQLFVAACLALLIGALLGFLTFNFPIRKPATIFMGDSGSLVVGLLLAFLTTRTTYTDLTSSPPHLPTSSSWYPLFMPLIVLAVPLYDFTSVVLIRLSQGKSPFVGDLQHLSHRLTRRGLSKRAAVLAICGFTAITGSNAIFLREMSPLAALFTGLQTLFVLALIALIEYAATPKDAG